EAEGAEALLDALTDREREVLELLGAGARPGTIATKLGISPNTVRTHIQNVLTKLGATSRLEAVTLLRPPAGPANRDAMDRSSAPSLRPTGRAGAAPDGAAPDGAVTVALAASQALVREG